MTQKELYAVCKKNISGEYSIDKSSWGKSVLIKNGQVTVKAYFNKDGNLQLETNKESSGWRFFLMILFFCFTGILGLFFHWLFFSASDKTKEKFKKEITDTLKSSNEISSKNIIVNNIPTKDGCFGIIIIIAIAIAIGIGIWFMVGS